MDSLENAKSQRWKQAAFSAIEILTLLDNVVLQYSDTLLLIKLVCKVGQVCSTWSISSSKIQVEDFTFWQALYISPTTCFMDTDSNVCYPLMRVMRRNNGSFCRHVVQISRESVFHRKCATVLGRLQASTPCGALRDNAALSWLLAQLSHLVSGTSSGFFRGQKRLFPMSESDSWAERETIDADRTQRD